MKRLNYLFLKCCLFLGAMFPIVPSAAQNTIYEVSSLFPENAIIRYWKESQYVVYSIDKDLMTHFTLFDYINMSCVDFSLKGIEVSDFEIEEEMVYFCGGPAGGATNPLFGYFDIPTLFSSGGGFNVVSLGGTVSSAQFPGFDERITSLMKLEVQTCPDGVHVYMIGEAICTFFSTVNRCIVDLRGDPVTGVWLGSFSQENASIYYYDDIAVTDAEVVVTGHKNGSSGHYVSSYPKPTLMATPLIPMLAPYMSFYQCSGGSNDYWLDPNRPTMIEHMFGNFTAIVGYANVSIGAPYINNRGVVISIYDLVANCVGRYVIPQGFADTAKWELKDIRYNAVTRRLYLLQEMSNPVAPYINSVMCVFDVNTAGLLVSANAFYEPDIKYFSLDQAVNDWESVVVGKSTPMRLWHHMMADNCVELMPLPLKTLQNITEYWEYGQYPVSIKFDVYQMSGLLNMYQIDLKCE